MACTSRPVPPRKGCRTGLQRIRVAFPVVLLCGATGAMLWSGSLRGGNEKTPREQEAAGRIDAEAARQLGERLALRQLLYRDRSRQRDLEQALEQVRQGDRLAGLESLQRILDRPDDVFFWDETTEELSSIRRELLDVFRGMDAATLRTYQSLYGADADRLLERARQSGRPADYRKVVQRFYFTSAGFYAADWLASHQFDCGQFGAAGRLWMQLLETAAHEEHLRPAHLARAAVALRLARRPEQASQLEERLPDRPVPVGGRSVAVREWLLREVAALQRTSLIGGDDQRGATVPYLRPVWTASNAEGGGAAVEHLIEDWHAEQAGGAQSLAVANHPTLVDGQAILRDFTGIRSFDLRTGETIWRYRDEGSLAKNASAAAAGGSSRLDVQMAYAGNSTLGTLTTDGRRLYAVDAMDLAAHDPSRTRNMFDRRSRVQLPETFRAGNRLIAIDLAAARAATGDVQPVWTAGGDPPKDGHLSGHFFMGPPLPLGERLFAITESNRQLNLVCLESASGNPLWIQPLSFVELPVDLDVSRFPLACTPAYADGVLVCPTESELLIGVDADRGALLWSYYYGDRPEQRALGRWPGRSRSGYGHSGFMNLPQVGGGRIVYLPRQSSHVHCIDAATGRRLWTASREDAEYLGTMTDGVVLAVGHRACRGLDADTGEELWSLPLGMPSGRGIAAEDRYLVPLQQGRVATIDVATGQEIGLTGNAAHLLARGAAPDGERPMPGNLCAADGLIVSVDALGIAVYPQAASLLAQVREDLSRDPENPNHHLLAAELEISLGRLALGKARLRSALAGVFSAEERARGEHLLRELLYRELREGADEAGVLAQLQQLARTPHERGGLLIETAESQLRRGDPEAALRSVRSFAQLQLAEPLRRTGEAAFLLSPESWIASAIGRISEQLGDRAQDRLLVQAQIEQQQALQSEEIAALEAFLRLYASLPQAAAVRLKLAEQLMARGESQRAELLLLQNRKSGDPAVAGSATRMLAQLFDAHGLHDEAAQLLEDLDGRFGDVAVDGPITGRRVAAEWSDAMTKAALKRRQGPPRPVRHVDVASILWSRNDPQVTETFNRFRRRYETPAGSPFHLLDKGTRAESLITVVNRLSGTTRGSIEVPNAQHAAAAVQNSHVGHFFPLGSPAAMHGISLLQLSSGKPLWTETPHEFGSRRDILRAGPAGPTFCAFQARQHLVVVDPGTGRTLWQRTDLDPGSGLVGDPYAGMFGDEEVLVMFAADRISYTVYRTATGEELRRGRLDIDTRKQRRVFGRRLYHISNSALGERMRIWDPLTDRMMFDEPAGRRPLAFVTPDDELAVLAPSAEGRGEAERLKVLDVRNGEVRVEVRLSAEDVENLNSIRVFRADDRYFVNLQRAITAPRARRVSSYVNDSFVDAMHVTGDFLAVDAHSGRVLWRRDLPQRSILQLPHVRLPFLVALSRIGDRWRGTQSALAVEIIDARTGQTLAQRDDLFLDNRILYAWYDHEEGRIELHGTKSVIELKFDAGRQRIPVQDPAL